MQHLESDYQVNLWHGLEPLNSPTHLGQHSTVMHNHHYDIHSAAMIKKPCGVNNSSTEQTRLARFHGHPVLEVYFNYDQ